MDLEKRVDKLETRVDSIENKIEAKIDGIQKELVTLQSRFYMIMLSFLSGTLIQVIAIATAIIFFLLHK